ncbi:Rieske Fe-S protein [Frankia canadensis]|uniref:Cytochrome bc1 complex Rieske iron-sulfur subunit n=1 Tax=Frankia canadensis TaxID=1836972 RepID=A0A2I2KSZ8_9ACTN|nr:Rieske (2Fe-2S) protein [Frankia canadensis]SNQ48780.1 Rieske Fe-S protein [Frankia canadensis]SOU56070.1 Rieske Fe-S protein [Frankia canadensis]
MTETANASPSRRIVVPGVVVTVVAGVAGYIVADQSDAAKPASTSAPAGSGGGGTGGGTGGGGGAAALAREADVAADSGVILGDLVLTRNAAGAVQGFSAVCTHQGCTVNAVSDGRIRCPCHGSAFDTRTGAPVAGPAKTPLPPVAVTVRDGEVFRA